MFKTIANAWKLADLRQKILYVIFIVFLYRIGAAIPMPFVDSSSMNMAAQSSGTLVEYLSIISGSAFSQAKLFALGISPYITASIVIQLLTVAIPYLERKQKEGEEGKKWLNQLTRIVTVVLGVITSIGYWNLLGSYDGVLTAEGKTLFGGVVIVCCYCAGSALVMWLAEKINENGIGNGISIILFVNIVSSLPTMVQTMWSQYLTSGNWVKIVTAVAVVLVSIAAIFFIVFITDSERKLPIQYAKKVVGRKMYGGQSSTLPLKLNMTGVMPIIFANSIVTLPATIAMFFSGGVSDFIQKWFGTGSWIYAILTFVLIIAFAYFYVTISFNPVEVANNLKKNGGFIPGIRPGKPTSDYITKVLSRITLIGALFLDIIAVLPLVANIISGNNLSALAFTGSSVIIIVGVVIETAREIESQMTMRHYKGFLE